MEEEKKIEDVNPETNGIVSNESTEENEVIEHISGPWQVIAYALKYRLKEILAVIVIFLIGAILIMNISYDKKNGFRWGPAAEINVEVKK